MLSYPVTLNPKLYTGNDPQKLAKYAQEQIRYKAAETHINQQLETVHNESHVVTFSNYEIASAIGITTDQMRGISIQVAGSKGGLTVSNNKHKPDEKSA